jgi:hypothetical protein
VAITFQVNTQASHLFCSARRKYDEGEGVSRQDLQLPVVLFSQLLQCLARRLAGDEKRADHHHPGFIETGQFPTIGKVSTHHMSQHSLAMEASAAVSYDWLAFFLG